MMLSPQRSRRPNLSQERNGHIRGPAAPAASITHHHQPALSAGARFTYQELIDATAAVNGPQPAVEEMFNPIIYQGIRYPCQQQQQQQQQASSNIQVLPPADGSYGIDKLPPVYLARAENAQQVYARIDNKSINLNHHDSNWGYVYFAVVYNRVYNIAPPPSSSAGDIPNSMTNYFQAPSSSKPEYVAIKQLNKKAVNNYLRKGGKENPYKEISRMQELGDNIHVLKCVEVLEDPEYLYIVTPKACSEGTLKDVIPWFQSENTMDPGRVRSIFKQLLNILLYLEHHGICHRDLSPDNFLFLTPDRLVVFDLALSLRVPTIAVKCQGQQVQQRRVLMSPQGNFGTFPYMPPEVFMDRPYDSVGNDLWSITVILYNMLTSQFLYEHPFPTDICFRYFILARGLSSVPLNELTNEILDDVYQGPHPIQTHSTLRDRAIAHLNLDEPAMELLENILVLDPLRRWTLAQTIESDFVNQPDEVNNGA